MPASKLAGTSQSFQKSVHGDNMSIHFTRTLDVGTDYKQFIKKISSDPTLKEYIENTDFFVENEEKQQIRYITEILQPNVAIPANKIPVVLLFSNPHPHSILQGMFLSPKQNSQKINLFWESMIKAEMFKLNGTNIESTIKLIEKKFYNPVHVKDMFINLNYESQFAFCFYCFFDFPSKNPTQLQDFFGDYFNKVYLAKSYKELACFLNICKSKDVICFGQQAFKYISKCNESSIGKDIKYAKVIKQKGCILSTIYSEVNNLEYSDIRLYLTCPTFSGGFKKEERVESLKMIKGLIQKHNKNK